MALLFNTRTTDISNGETVIDTGTQYSLLMYQITILAVRKCHAKFDNDIDISITIA